MRKINHEEVHLFSLGVDSTSEKPWIPFSIFGRTFDSQSRQFAFVGLCFCFLAQFWVFSFLFCRCEARRSPYQRERSGWEKPNTRGSGTTPNPDRLRNSASAASCHPNEQEWISRHPSILRIAQSPTFSSIKGNCLPHKPLHFAAHVSKRS